MEETSKKVRQREIKFRLYFYERKRLTYSTHTFEVTDKRLHIMLARFDENTIVGFVQWTGLKDKNDKDIYEGDVISYRTYWKTRHKTSSKLMDVIFEDGRFQLRFLSNQNPAGDMMSVSQCGEVIGNIYEHPHLLSQGEIKTELI